jgi:hypothetical protein
MFVATKAAHVEKSTSSLKMANSYGRNMPEKKLTIKSLV